MRPDPTGWQRQTSTHNRARNKDWVLVVVGFARKPIGFMSKQMGTWSVILPFCRFGRKMAYDQLLFLALHNFQTVHIIFDSLLCTVCFNLLLITQNLLSAIPFLK